MGHVGYSVILPEGKSLKDKMRKCDGVIWRGNGSIAVCTVSVLRLNRGLLSPEFLMWHPLKSVELYRAGVMKWRIRPYESAVSKRLTLLRIM